MHRLLPCRIIPERRRTGTIRRDGTHQLVKGYRIYGFPDSIYTISLPTGYSGRLPFFLLKIIALDFPDSYILTPSQRCNMFTDFPTSSAIFNCNPKFLLRPAGRLYIADRPNLPVNMMVFELDQFQNTFYLHKCTGITEKTQHDFNFSSRYGYEPSAI